MFETNITATVVALGAIVGSLGCYATTTDSGSSEDAAAREDGSHERNPKLREDYREEYHPGYGDRVTYHVVGSHVASRLVETERMQDRILFNYNEKVYGGFVSVMPPLYGDTLRDDGEWEHGGDYWIVADGDYIYEGCYPTYASAFGYTAQVIECSYRSHWASWKYGTDSGQCSFSWIDAISSGFCAAGLATSEAVLPAAVALSACAWTAVTACLG